MNLVKGKKILLVGLGRLGGGAATAKFLVKNGAKLTVTDLNSKKELKNSFVKLKNFRIKYALGEHKEDDFKNNEIIIFNQAVSVDNKWVQFARKNKKQIETDLTLMLKILGKERPEMEYVAITGTRGKTTTATWAHHLLKPASTDVNRGTAYIGGNIPELAPLKVLEKILRLQTQDNDRLRPLILEIPSYQFEYWELNKKLKAPKVAVITNLYVDHLNRHGTMENYAKAKARIFSNQAKNNFLILNGDIDNEVFLRQKIRSRIFYISAKKLPDDKNGLYFSGSKIIFQKDRSSRIITEAKDFSVHQKYNLLSALLAGHLWGSDWDKLAGKISSLPEVKYRQQIILKTPKLTVVNDSAATSPEAVIAAIEKFTPLEAHNKAAFIIGGTDKQLDFKNLGKEIDKKIQSNDLYLLNGSGTRKLIDILEKLKYKNKELKIFENLKDIILAIKKRKDVNLIVFSPGAASFEKFKNEFDRGQKFDKLIQDVFK